MRIILASSNEGKVKEIKNIFSDTNYEIVSLSELNDVPEIEEDQDTYEGNARKKAETIFTRFNMPVMADDSGLSVEQLNGEPGVYSARYAGEGCTYHDNNVKLLNELSVHPEPHFAKFICCAVYLDDKKYFSVFGEIPGRIIREIRGEKGFGYDPVFLPYGFDKTLAELDLKEKNGISHRGQAFNRLKEIVKKEIQ